MTKTRIALATILLCISTLATADECTPARYSLVFAINAKPTGVAGYSQATVTACLEGLTEKDIANYRSQLVDIHRKNNPSLTNDQVILLDFKLLRSGAASDSNALPKRGVITI